MKQDIMNSYSDYKVIYIYWLRDTRHLDILVLTVSLPLICVFLSHHYRIHDFTKEGGKLQYGDRTGRRLRGESPSTPTREATPCYPQPLVMVGMRIITINISVID